MIKNYLPLAIFSLLLSALSLTSPAHAQSSCTNYYLPGIPAPSGYGAAYDVVSGTNALLASVDCSGSSPVFTIGRNAPADYIYAKGYVYTTSWQELSLSSPNPSVATVWYPKIATASVPSPSSSWTFVVGYVCSWTGTLWKCGCADSVCTTPGWNLQAYEASQSSPPSTWGGTPNANAVVIAPSGLDSNPCTVSAPCASLEKAQSAVRSSSTKIVYLRAGTYPRSQTLTLTSADNGETWQTYPGDAVDSAIIDGTNGGNYVNIFTVNGGSNITWNGLQIQNVAAWAIGIHGGTAAGGDIPQLNVTTGPASGNTVINSIIHDTHSVPPNGWSSALWALHDVPNTTFNNNLVYNTYSEALSIQVNGTAQDGNISGSKIANNVVLNAATGPAGDTGAIYTQNPSGNGSLSTSMLIQNNFIRDWGRGARAIYLDQGSANITVSGNIIGPPTPSGISAGSSAVFLGSNHNSHVTGNIIDLGTTGRAITYSYTKDTGLSTPTTGNTFEGNIVISNFAGNQSTGSEFGASGYSFIAGGGGISAAVQNNSYHNYGGGQERTDGNQFSDTAPVHTDPQISGWIYSIAAGSSVYNTPVNFPHIVGGWGPPGYTIPQTGTPPSSPH